MQNQRAHITRRAFLGMQGYLLSSALTACASAEDSGAPEVEQAAPRTLDEIRASGAARVGMITDNRPFSYIAGDGNYSGFDHFFCLWLTERTGIPVEYVAVDCRDRYEALYSNKVDICLAQASPLDSLAGEADFAEPFYTLQLALVSRADASVESADQLSQGELIVCEGSYAQQYAAETWPKVTLRPYNTLTDAFAAFEEGKGIGLLSDEIAVVGWAGGKSEFVVGMKGIGEPRPIAPAVARGQEELLEQLEDAIGTFYMNGRSKRVYETYIKPYVGDSYTSMMITKR